ncbi:TetR/AcrR family transcriptional regulator [Microbacterium laevaniformans]|uniref:TetR/AcrR family transcriptional regulator n=1 Tax=Microbacterium laevaniformans TaxID=36807 RepID=UPI003639C2DC|nr:helix-turn-helix domain containing protein [Sphingomonas sp. BLCC-B65]
MSGRKPYASPLREAEAAATRARIVDAAAELFVRDGYAATSLKAIAAAAGVSVQTVNLHGPKHALLAAAYERALADREGWASLNDTDPMQQIIAEPDPERLIAMYAAFMTAANARIAALLRTLRAAADADPAVRDVYAAIDERRLRSIREGVALLAARGVVPPDRSDDATALVTMLVSTDTYLHFREAGWSAERYREWLAVELRRAVAG